MYAELERLVPLLVAALAYAATLFALRPLFGHSAAIRPVLHYATLLVGAVALVFALWHLHDDNIAAGVAGPGCWPLWTLAASGIGASGFVCGFLVRQSRFVARLDDWAQPAPPTLAATLALLARRLKLAYLPEVRVLPWDRPLACAVGIRQPRIYLSTWMVEELAPAELEGVLAHELAHVARRDNLVALVATAFLGATACLPSSWSALRNLLHERELAADELAVSITGKPITLARVLHKVASADLAATGIASGLLEAATAEARIHHLVALHRAGTGSAPGIAHWPWIPVLTLVAPPVLAWLVFALPHLLALP